VLNASENRRDMKTIVDHSCAAKGTKSISAEAQNNTDLLYLIPRDIMTVPKANTESKRRDKTGGK
jgi:hypothetical protein